MGSDWVVKTDQFHAAIACTVGVGIATAAAWFASRWWRGRRATVRGKGARKPLGQSPGIRVVRFQAGSTAAGSESKNGRGLRSALLGGGSESATKWEKSKRKGEMGYYFAHHTSMKELAPEDYRMNEPRLLSKGTSTPDEGAHNGSSYGTAAAPAPTTQRRRAEQISSYSWEDCGEEVRLSFRQSGWEWSKVEESEIVAEWQPRRFRLSIDSREYGLHKMDLQRLSGEVADVRVLKMRSKIVVALVKGGRGSYRKAPWTELQAKHDEPDADDPFSD